MDDVTKRAVRAKLFNFRSQVDGMVGMVDADVFDLQQLDNAVGCLCNQLLKSLADMMQDGP
jgi:hypothetical protein